MGSSTIRAQGSHPPDSRPTSAEAAGAGLRAEIAAAVARGPYASEGFRVDTASFCDHVMAVTVAPGTSGVTDAESLVGLRLDELYLTFGCGQGDARALGVFERSFVRPIVTERIGRIRLAAHEVEEVRQKLREDLLVDVGSGCRILQYSGRGDLAGFVRVSALRIALKLVQKRERPGNDDAALDRISLERDPELAFVKDAYRPAFSAAFRAAIEGLEGRERLLLRQQVVDGLSIDALGTLYGVHRSTVARWLVTARENLLVATRAAFAAKMAVQPAELESLFGLLHSRLDLSLRNVL